ncbi:MAG: amidohydrolase family protein, partial [Actinobacteria bacterium]|nr:amidohydrolase family protein [Actinomycetota bacterium]
KKALCANHGSLSTVSHGTDELIELLKRYKDFLYGYLVFNPNFEELSLKTIEKNLLNKKIIGIKIHPSWHGCYPYDKRYERFWAFIEEASYPVLTHSWNPDVANKAQRFSDPFLFEDIVKKHKKLKLILAHAGGRGDMLYRVISLLEKYENLYVDFAGDIFVPGLIETYVQRLGSDRILFGSDTPWIDFRFHLENIISADIKESDKANIFGLNAANLFRLDI